MQEDKNAMFQMRFPQKLWYLLNLRTDAILWGGTGRTILLNYRVLHSYLQCDHSIFKTTNISSFVRQLNLYGFRKVTSHLQDPLCNSSNPYMHEYVHDFFQFGRPELLNKINRKALTMKKTFKHKSIHVEDQLSAYLTPLQKARRALRIALKKASQDLFLQGSPKLFNVECDDTPEDICEDEENMELDWLTSKPMISNFNKQAPAPETQIRNSPESSTNYGNTTEDILSNFNDESNQQHTESDSFPTQFLSMPELDPVPADDTHGVELLAEFNINDNRDDNIVTKIGEKREITNTHSSLNCVLPSISNDQNDDVSMAERNTGYSGHYHGEWDQMFNDIISKGSSQECGSDLKDLYSQISKTIDLLNS